MIAFALAVLLSAAPDAGTDPHEVYLEAYTLKESDPTRARELFKWVVDHTKKKDAEHEKAKRWLRDLKGKH